MLCQYNPASTDRYTLTLENFGVESTQLSPLLKSIALNMAIKEKSAVPVYPSDFLWVLKHKISSTRSAPFDFKSQHDVADILQIVFDELKGSSLRTDELFSSCCKF